jgi:release factor glutamine methyltransferase
VSAAPEAAFTIAELRREGAAKLRAAGVESPEADARILLGFALGLDEAGLVSASKLPISRVQQARFAELLNRRIAGEPVARIIGAREFWGRRFRLGPETLVPRPETETVVEAALSIFPEANAKLRILDLGTGSGILLGALLLERMNATGVGIDRSEHALQIARRNLDELGVADRAQFICGDWTAALGPRFDLIVANPPYIESEAILKLDREVRNHDPRLALDGGADGLDCYRRIIAELPQSLSPGGAAVLELGIGQESAVTALAQSAGLSIKGALADLAGTPRALMLYLDTRK